MPRYDVQDKNTGEIFEVDMKISEMEQYFLDNPHLEQVFLTGIAFNADVVKPDKGWTEVLQGIHSRTPGSRLNKLANI